MRNGRTCNLAQRRSQHSRAFPKLRFKTSAETDDPDVRRGLEEMDHNKYNPPLNKIRPISPMNPNRQRYMDAAEEFMNGNGGEL